MINPMKISTMHDNLSDENRVILQYVKSGGEGVFTIVKKMTQMLSKKMRKIEKERLFILRKMPILCHFTGGNITVEMRRGAARLITSHHENT